MRGRLAAYSGRWRILRLTPANAGTTSGVLPECGISQAHPRECGDDAVKWMLDHLGQGSPPRMRGRLHNMLGGITDAGLTPANAGTTAIR